MKLLRVLAVLLLLVAAGTWWLVKAPYGPRAETFVDIPAGTNTAGMATRLKSGGVIRSAFAFAIYRRLHGGTLRAGEYRFDHPVALTEIYARIARGDVYTLAVVIPEGFNLFDIAGAVQTAGLGSSTAFLAAARRDTHLIADLNPRAASLEGYLFPDTYRFSRHASPDAIVAALVKRFRQVAAQIGLLAPPGSVGDRSLYDLPRTVLVASLVEKEVRVDTERPLVAGVFENRLRLGMPLATDPTVIYAALLEDRWRGTIYQSDLASTSPYNTYRRAGLPPGPISNPGVAALKAAMSPAHTDYLYFVADAQGHSRFSVDLKEHEKQVAAYRNAQRQAP